MYTIITYDSQNIRCSDPYQADSLLGARNIITSLLGDVSVSRFEVQQQPRILDIPEDFRLTI